MPAWEKSEGGNGDGNVMMMMTTRGSIRRGEERRGEERSIVKVDQWTMVSSSLFQYRESASRIAATTPAAAAAVCRRRSQSPAGARRVVAAGGPASGEDTRSVVDGKSRAEQSRTEQNRTEQKKKHSKWADCRGSQVSLLLPLSFSPVN